MYINFLLIFIRSPMKIYIKTGRVAIVMAIMAPRFPHSKVPTITNNKESGNVFLLTKNMTLAYAHTKEYPVLSARFNPCLISNRCPMFRYAVMVRITNNNMKKTLTSFSVMEDVFAK